MFRNGYIYVRIRHMLRDKSNKRDRIRSNLLATLSAKSGTATALGSDNCLGCSAVQCKYYHAAWVCKINFIEFHSGIAIPLNACGNKKHF